MRSLVALAAILLAASLPKGPVLAQVAPYWLSRAPYAQPNLTAGDLHRYEMDRLRAQADRNQALADAQAAQARLTIQQLQAQRQSPPSVASVTPSLSLDRARRTREETETRSLALIRSTSQIDAWLDRSPQ